MDHRVLHVINRLKRGGAQTLLYYTLSRLQSNANYSFDVAVLFEKQPLVGPLTRQGLSVTKLGQRPKWNPGIFFNLVAYLRANQYDLVHVHLFPAGLFVAFASVLFPNIPLIYTEHNEWNRRREWEWWKPIDRFMYSRYREILCVSDRVSRSLVRWLPSVAPKVTTIANAVPISRFDCSSDNGVEQLKENLSIPADSQVLLFIGRLAEAKGVDVLLDAFSSVKKNTFLLIAGSGSLRDVLIAQAHQQGVEQHTQFLGVRKDIPRLLALSDVVVLPSRWEGLPMVLLEAMAARKPVIATKVGGMPEVIEHGVTGWLIPPEDSDALAEAMGQLLASPQLRSSLGEAAHALVKSEYSIQVFADRLIGLYDEILQ
jgi:glycosyltransferase involved in cell wall biosynthesis